MEIDYREKKIFKHWPNAKIVNLLIGDIHENGYVIERKTIPDLLSSITNNRIFNQAINMYENYPGKCCIIVEGDLQSIAKEIFFTKRHISIVAIRGAIARLYAMGVPVLFASTKKGFVDMTNAILEKNTNSGNTIVYEPPIKKEGANTKLQILLQIPGIGLTKAKKILEHYGTFENIKLLERPPKVSEKDIETIIEALK